MKTKFKTIMSTIIIALFSLQTVAQKIPKPKVDLKVPKVKTTTSGNDTPSTTSSGNSETKTSPLNNVAPTKQDPSGLFSNISDDVSAKSHRNKAVENLNTLESMYKSEKVDYEGLNEIIENNEITLQKVKKLEPAVNADKYNERYLPIKTRVVEDYAVYSEVKKMEKLIANEYSAPLDVNEVHIPSYSAFFSDKKECYCSREEPIRSYQEYLNVKKEYEAQTSKLIGYSNEITQKYFIRMVECIEGGNKYAQWVAKDNLKLEVIDFNEKEKPLNPELVIEKCKHYTDAITLIENDKSLSLSAEAKTALDDAKKQVAAIKTEAERYITSGEFEKHKAKVHAEKILKEFLPKAVASNSTLTSGATKYITGQEMKTYLIDKLGMLAVASVLKANLTTAKPEIVKNELDIPKYKYQVIWVAYKDSEGKCFKTPVYATYYYLGGGTYETTPTYSADAPIEMACENVNK